MKGVGSDVHGPTMRRLDIATHNPKCTSTFRTHCTHAHCVPLPIPPLPYHLHIVYNYIYHHYPDHHYPIICTLCTITYTTITLSSAHCVPLPIPPLPYHLHIPPLSEGHVGPFNVANYSQLLAVRYIALWSSNAFVCRHGKLGNVTSAK
jgi:hypothetical protein